MENKAFSAILIKALNEERREISGMASTPAPDRVNDVVEPLGLTFAKEVPLLLDHKHDQPVGTVRFGAPTAKGLPFTATIAKVAEAGEVKNRVDRAWHSVKSGLIKAVSIGFMPKEAKALSNGGTRYTKAAIHELSLVAIPANPEAVITAFKSLDLTAAPAVIPTPIPAPTIQTRKEIPSMSKQVIPAIKTVAQQIIKAIGQDNEQAYAAVTKDAVASMTTANTPTLYYPTQQPGVIVPPSTLPLLAAFANMGAPQLPPNTRVLTQAELLEASEIDESGFYPGVSPTIDFMLSGRRKFGLIMPFANSLIAPLKLNTGVVAYVQDQLEAAANNATDAFIVGLLTSQGVAATSVAAAFAAFGGDLRTAVFIGHPKTLATLQDAANPNVGPRGGFYKTLPLLPSMAVPVGTLILQDVKRIAVYDGEQEVIRSDDATLNVDTPDGPKVLYLFQENLTALRITKFGDAKVMVAPQIITLA